MPVASLLQHTARMKVT